MLISSMFGCFSVGHFNLFLSFLDRFLLCYRVSVLADNGTMAPSELRLNSETFSWLTRIPPILAEHKLLINQSRREAEDGLKVGNHFSSIDRLTLTV